MKSVFIVSVGLNVGEQEPAAQLQRSIESIGLAFGPVLAVAMGKSEWEGVPERFVQCAVLAHAERMADGCALLARHLDQCAVAWVPAAHLADTCPRWVLAYSAPGVVGGDGGEVTQFPVIVDYPTEA
jgi:hypothetical protein